MSVKTEDIQIETFPNIAFRDARVHGADCREMSESGDLKAESSLFWELVAPHKHKLYNFIHKSLSYSSSADDVYQETLLRGLKYFKSFQKDKSISTWLFKIAHHEIKRHRRKESRHIPLGNLERLPVKDESTDRLLVREIHRLADELKPKSREVFFLYYGTGFKVDEIAGITGLKPGNVKFILSKAREAIRHVLGE